MSTDTTTGSTVLLAGGAGDLGSRIAAALTARGTTVRALVRPDASPADRQRLTDLGASLTAADPADVDALAAALTGASVVVSALNGLREVIIGRQSVLLEAAVLAGVPRFISSDFSSDFTKTRPGRNRNFDLRREFMARADQAPIQVTSILNGAFMDMLGAEMPIIAPQIKRVLHVGDRDQPLDFTTKDDVAAYTAAAAMDPSTPRILRIAGETVSARGIADTLSDVTGTRYRSLRVGGTAVLSTVIRITQTLAPERESTFPAWQGMQYLRDMFTGDARLAPLDNDRYGDLPWTPLRAHLSSTPLTAA